MLLSLLAVLGFVVLNGFFVAAEFAIVKVRRSQIDLKATRGNYFALQAKSVVDRLDAYLSACQLGITLSSLALGWLGEPVVATLVESTLALFGVTFSPTILTWLSLGLSFTIITFLHIVLGELVPKAIAIRKAEKTSYIIALPLKAFYFTFLPFIALMNGIALAILRLLGIPHTSEEDSHSADELQMLAQKSQEQGELKQEKFKLVHNALEFDRIRAGSLMVPKDEVYAINLEWERAKIWDALLNSPYSRVVCYKGSWDQICGFVHLKDFLKEAHSVDQLDFEKYIYQTLFISEDRHLDHLLEDFKHNRIHLIMVVDEFGNSMGMVTLEDVLEVLVGEIQDEDDQVKAPTEVEVLEENSWRIDAKISLRKLNEELLSQFDDEEFNTLAGLLLNHFGVIPSVGQMIQIHDFEFTIELIKDKRIAMVVAQRI